MSMLPPLTLLAPMVLLLVALLALATPGRRPRRLPRLAEGAALAALALAVAGLGQLVMAGPASWGPFRVDVIGTTMVVLVGFVGWVVVRYARSYLDGEAREGAFHGVLLATLAAVLLLVQAGSLALMVAAFIAVGIGLRWLLLFYPDRAAAQRAAAKFSLVWHGGDVALMLAAGLFYGVPA